MSHLVCNGELTKTRRNCLRCSWTSASSAWVFLLCLRRSWVTHKLQEIAPQLLSRQVGGVAILLKLQYDFGIVKSLAKGSQLHSSHFFAAHYLNRTEKCTLNYR